MIAFFLFYDESSINNAKLKFFTSKDFRHCNVIVYEKDCFIMIDYENRGIVFKEIKAKSIENLIEVIKRYKAISKFMHVKIEKRAEILWTLICVMSCNEFCRMSTGVEIGYTFNVAHLYKKLLKYNNKKNYRIIENWERPAEKKESKQNEWESRKKSCGRDAATD